MSFMKKHRVSIRDLSLLAVALSVAAFICFEVDVFVNEDPATIKSQVIELDEALLLGGIFAVGLLIFAVRRYIEQRREMRRRVAAEQRIRELAFQDPLTGLANRRQFDDALAQAIASPPGADALHALFLLDLNGFKQINDVYGHGVGDDVLIALAQRLVQGAVDGHLVARLGGDEFALVALHLAGPEAATSIALRIMQELEAPCMVGGVGHRIAAGIGIACIPQDADTPRELMRRADVALYRAKAERRSALRFFEPEMDRMVRERARVEAALREAIATHLIRAVFQPSIDLKTHRVVGFEARPYWLDETLGLVAPERFLPIAEEAGLIHELAEQLLREACTAAVSWPGDISVSVDLFPGQFTDPGLKARILAILAETGLAPARLEMEITESALVQHLSEAQEVLGALRQSGVRIALDNFGTGYSSLYHLRSFKVDKVKIDRSFIASMASEQESAEIVNALIGLGRGLGLTLAAEGIDDSTQQAALMDIGLQQGQGVLYSLALGVPEALALIAERNPAEA
jgi:diguanylate cyclase (GGDEF)-like protein